MKPPISKSPATKPAAARSRVPARARPAAPGTAIAKGSPEARQFTVDTDDDGIRLDRWFHRHLPDVNFNLVSRWARTGQVRLDGKRVGPGDRIVAVNNRACTDTAVKNLLKGLSGCDVTFVALRHSSPNAPGSDRNINRLVLS